MSYRVCFTAPINLGDKGSEKQFNISLVGIVCWRKAPATAVLRVNLLKEMFYEVLNLKEEIDGVFLAIVHAC